MTTATLYTVTIAASGPPPAELRKHGACRNQDSALFFADGESSAANDDARRICRACPARRACLDYALPISGLAGIWGGMSAQQRASERRRRGYVDGFHSAQTKTPSAPRRRAATEVVATPARAGCPSEAMYRAHRRLGEDCAACRRYVSAVNMERRRRRGGR